MLTQICDYIKNHSIVHFEMVDFYGMGSLSQQNCIKSRI